MPDLKGTKTHENLKAAFAGESQANRRYLYFAKQADVEGYPEAAGNFRDTAEGETGHAHGHLDYLKKVGDPATDLPIGDTVQNLKAAVAGETHEYTDMYPGMAARPPATKASTRSPTGSKRSPRPRSHTPVKLPGASRVDHLDHHPQRRAPHVVRDPARPSPEVPRLSEIISCRADGGPELRPYGRRSTGTPTGCSSKKKSSASSTVCQRVPYVLQVLRLVSRILFSSCIDDEHDVATCPQADSPTQTRSGSMDACFQCKLCEVQCPVHASRPARISTRLPQARSPL